MVSCLGPRKDASIAFIWANWSMTCGSSDEGWDTTLVLVVLQMDGWCVVSEWMLVSILSVSMDPREISWAEAAMALLYVDLTPEDLLRPFLLMGIFKKLNLS